MLGNQTTLNAVELSTGFLYEGGTRVQSSELGLSLTIPSGWQGALPLDVDAFVIQKQGAQDTILVRADQVDKLSILTMMNQPITLNQGMILMPMGKAVERSGVIEGKYTISVQYAEAQAEIRIVLEKHGVIESI